MLKLLTSLLLVFLLSGCHHDDYTPKPRGYFRIEYPKHKYKLFEPKDCPFSFEIPDYAFVVPDSNSLSDPCWYYVIMPRLNGQLYLTYKAVHGNLRDYMEDTRTLVYKHTSRASSIDERLVSFNKGVYGVLYDIGGDAASPSQFFVTDSSTNFLRGALYFNAEPNADSIAPSIAFVKEDIEHMLKTLKWK